MTHITEDDLVSLALDDAPDDLRASAARHLPACAACTAAMEEIRATLGAASTGFEVPERGDEYGAQVWAAIESRLPSRESGISVSDTARPPAAVVARWSPWLAAAAALIIAAGSYWLGRQSATPPSTGVGTTATNAPSSAAPGSGIRERVVLAALGEHLDRTERTLVELVNSDPGAQVDISAEQAWARDLLEANRLYRQAAGAQGPALTQLLDDLEPVLLEIANSPARLTSDEFEGLRARIDARSLVFKVRVTGANVRARAQALTRGESTL
jgi:hypothetical protein